MRIDGFKNLVDVELYFGPFTCIAGANSVGKSNLFDAIRFLSELTEKTLIDAAKSVRSEGQKNSDIRDIFHRVGNKYSDKISIEVEMITPKFAVDDLGQKAESTITSLKYTLILKYKKSGGDEIIQIEKEVLEPINQSVAKQNLFFDKSPEWTNSIIEGRRSTSSPFISTKEKGGQLFVFIHQDRQKGRALEKIASTLPRTVLSTVTAEYPTACVARQEMISWMLLQLSPDALRKSDDFDKKKNAQIQANGANLPATLYRLKMENPKQDIYQQLANRLSQLIEGVNEIKVDKDSKRELLTLMLTYKGGEKFPARSLSDGTLRFLALAVLELDKNNNGVICLEEPENGIHPQKIENMIQLLKEIATDTQFEVESENPLRQVIINTHSPIVVQSVPEESLLVAELKEGFDETFQQKFSKTTFSPLNETWRTKIPNTNIPSVSIGKLLNYLNPVNYEDIENAKTEIEPKAKHKRVIDRSDVRQQKTNL